MWYRPDRLRGLEVRRNGVGRLQLFIVRVQNRHQWAPAMVETIAAALSTMASPTATRSAESLRKRTAPCSHGIIASVRPMPMMTAVAIARAGIVASEANVLNRDVIAAPMRVLPGLHLLVAVHPGHVSCRGSSGHPARAAVPAAAPEP